jgi:hypothetical protein
MFLTACLQRQKPTASSDKSHTVCLRLLLSLARAICRRAQAAELASASQPAQPAAARAASSSGHRVTFAETQRSAAQEPAVAPAAAAATAAAVNNSADPSATMAAFAALAARRPELRSYLGSVSAGRGFQLTSRLVFIVIMKVILMIYEALYCPV